MDQHTYSVLRNAGQKARWEIVQSMEKKPLGSALILALYDLERYQNENPLIATALRDHRTGITTSFFGSEKILLTASRS